jgi:HSP20 family molecular chaperone IbpA
MAANTMNRTHDVRRVEQPRQAETYVPAVDILEKADGLVLRADMPGVASGDVEIQYEQGVLTIHGRVQPPKQTPGRYLVREYGNGDYVRSFTLGEGIDIDKIEAVCRNGVLELRLPKAEALKPRRIEVKA